MHTLKVFTQPTDQPDTFDVRWTNSQIRPRGVIRVKVAAKIKDREIAAELAALKYLLEEKEVMGNNIAGHEDLELVVSHGAIRKLYRKQSNKSYLSPWANFLVTRFKNCRIRVDKDTRWFDGIPPESVENLLLSKPQREAVKLYGFGEVAISIHLLDRFIERCLFHLDPAKASKDAWRRLVEVCSQKSVREVRHTNQVAALKAAMKGKEEGRYFLNEKARVVMVVAKDSQGDKQIVTIYPAPRIFFNLPRAA